MHSCCGYQFSISESTSRDIKFTPKRRIEFITRKIKCGSYREISEPNVPIILIRFLHGLINWLLSYWSFYAKLPNDARKRGILPCLSKPGQSSPTILNMGPLKWLTPWIFTAHKRSLRRLCFYTCLSVILFTVGEGIPACLAGSQAHTQGEVEGFGGEDGGVSRPTPKGEVEESDLGGVFRPTSRGGFQAHTQGGL